MMWLLVYSSWILHVSCNKRRVAPIAALLSSVLHYSVFGDERMHEFDNAAGPLKWVCGSLHPLISIIYLVSFAKFTYSILTLNSLLRKSLRKAQKALEPFVLLHCIYVGFGWPIQVPWNTTLKSWSCSHFMVQVCFDIIRSMLGEQAGFPLMDHRSIILLINILLDCLVYWTKYLCYIFFDSFFNM